MEIVHNVVKEIQAAVAAVVRKHKPAAVAEKYRAAVAAEECRAAAAAEECKPAADAAVTEHGILMKADAKEAVGASADAVVIAAVIVRKNAGVLKKDFACFRTA